MRAKLTIFSIILLFAFSLSAFGNGLSLNSPGPKGLGMGGAMVGLADDYTTIYWNPAGMTNLEDAQIGVFVTDIIPMGSYEVTFPQQLGGAKADAETEMNHYISPNAMAYLPLMEGDLTVGLSAFVPAGLGAEWNGADLLAFSGPTGKEFKWSNEIAAINFSPGVAYKIHDMIRVGVAVNVFYAMLDMDRPMDMVQIDPQTGQIVGMGEDGIMDTQYSESSSGLGVGISAGALIKLLDFVSVGISFKSAMDVAMDGDATNSTIPGESTFERDLGWPMWLGFGIAFMPTDALTLCLDFQWSQWSESEEMIETVYADWPDPQTQQPPMTNEMHLKWEDALQIRFGAQYAVEDNFFLRFGAYHDPAPSPDETLTIIFPSITYFGTTLGASYFFGPLGLDFGIEYLFGSEREVAFGEYDEAMPGIHNMNILAASLGVSFRFGL